MFENENKCPFGLSILCQFQKKSAKAVEQRRKKRKNVIASDKMEGKTQYLGL